MLTSFCQLVLQDLKVHAPVWEIRDVKAKHPWLNDRCRKLIASKWSAVSTNEFEILQQRCTAALQEAYADHLARQRETLSKTRPSGTKWWNTGKNLMCKTAGASVIPPLSGRAGAWAVTSTDKSNLLADALFSKSKLPAAVPYMNQSSPSRCSCCMSGVLPVRLRKVSAELRRLRTDSSTGPDGISAVVWKECSVALAFPLTLLARAVLSQGRWPQGWKIHWMYPLHKKKSKSDPVNYRLIHLTAQMSKVVERVLGGLFLPYLEASGSFGPNQFAYSRGRGLQDALALNTLRWIHAISVGRRVGLYCSDVSGAFDRVSSELLMETLADRGLHPQVLAVTRSWLEPRSAHVVVDGVQSRQCMLSDSVYQGTVLGPPLWNTHFAGAAGPLRWALLKLCSQTTSTQIANIHPPFRTK